LRYYRTTGLEITQMQELVLRVHGELAEPWKKGTGRPKSCGLYEAAEIACMYIRQNVTEEFLGDLRHVSQSTVSRIVTVLVPIVKSVLEEFVPSAADAIEMVRGRICLVDGTIAPCWSYEDHRELWSRKHGTTGFNAQLICVLNGNPVYISEPLPGKSHDVAAFRETPVAEIVKNSGGGIGDKGYQGSGMVTPVKKPEGGELTVRTKDTTPRSRRCAHRSSDSSRTLSRGGYYTRTTGAPTELTVMRTTLLAGCTSSQLYGVLNKLPGRCPH
jgi:hypothetical protein